MELSAEAKRVLGKFAKLLAKVLTEEEIEDMLEPAAICVCGHVRAIHRAEKGYERDVCWWGMLGGERSEDLCPCLEFVVPGEKGTVEEVAGYDEE